MRDNNPRAQQIINKIEKLSKSYTPEWHFDTENPDIGSTIGLVYASQTEETLAAMAGIAERYHTEFVNFLDLSLLPAKPARCICLMSLVGDTIPGAHVAKGTKLSAALQDREDVVFETEHNLYVTNARITDVFSVSAQDGRPVPLLGTFVTDLIVKEDSQAAPAEASMEDFNEAEEGMQDVVRRPRLMPFTMFEQTKGIGSDAVLFYHPSLFDTDGTECIYVRFEDADVLCEKVRKCQRAFYYYSEEGLLPVDAVEVLPDGKTFALTKTKSCKKLVMDDRAYSLLVLKSEELVDEVETVRKVMFASAGEKEPARCVTDGNKDMNPEGFAPFSDSLALFSELYIGHDEYFAKCGAKATIQFQLSFEESMLSIPMAEEDASLKIIKRKPKIRHMDVPVGVYAQEISLEYYNGIGWSMLQTDTDITRLFADGLAKEVEFSFIIPEDWEAVTIGSAESRYLRIRLLKADNCYLRPGIHHMPHIQGLTVGFSYQDSYADAKRIELIRGTKKKEVTAAFLRAGTGEVYPLFQPSEYQEDAIYIGMNRKMEEGPVSLFFRLSEDTRFAGPKCRFEYSSASGFKAMKVVDYTNSFTKSGIVLFIPQPDMREVELEGKKRYWLRIVRVKKSNVSDDFLPTLLSVEPNAVLVSNIETSEERDFFVDEPMPNMSFGLSERNILSIDLWVNEVENLSNETMSRMEQEIPERIRCSKDDSGNYTSFFVLWEETESFLGSKSRSVYILDRLNRRILFGDGLHTDYPQVTSSTAFMVRIRRCVGSLGNVPEGSITDTKGNIRFIGNITNPVRAYGGSDMETIPAALMRGANMLHSRGRLISAGDYERAICGFSDSIVQVKCLVTEDVSKLACTGRDIVLIILMRDFAYGSFSFHQIEMPLLKFLCERCELTLPMERIALLEPVFVEISVDVWANVLDIDDSFELTPLIQQLLENFLNPVAGEGGNGWRIGTLPRVSQVQMCLGVLKSRLIIKKLSVSAAYKDADGLHEADLSELTAMPYMVCKSGVHHVHIIQ